MSKKVAYVTGGMGGIGTAVCRRLHDTGYFVIAGCGPSRDYNKWLAEQKAEVISAVTRAYAEAAGKNPSSVWVTITEVPRENWGVGGTPLG